MIPKTIHYCWFGRGKLPFFTQKCMDSWERFLPEYEIRLWNENTFNVYSIPYTCEAYQKRKYAFVADYVRLYALYKFGGIYMDTDVEILKSLNDLLHLPGFVGYEHEQFINTGIIACEPNNEWAKEQLEWYEGKHFIKSNGKSDMTSNVQIISSVMKSNGFYNGNCLQIYKDCMYVFPKDYFCPKSRSGIITITDNTYCIHHYAASWVPWHLKAKKILFQNILGPKITDILVRTKRSLLKKIS